MFPIGFPSTDFCHAVGIAECVLDTSLQVRLIKIGSAEPLPFVIAHGATEQGARTHQEDRFLCQPNLGEEGLSIISFFGVYDGHGGHKAADFVTENLHKNFAAEMRR